MNLCVCQKKLYVTTTTTKNWTELFVDGENDHKRKFGDILTNFLFSA